MINFFKKYFVSSTTPVNYNFELDFFLNNEHKVFFKENGYVVIKNIVSEYAINSILAAFNKLKSHSNYYESDGFITSANYGIEIQNQLHTILKEVNDEILPKLFHIDKIYHDLLNVLVLKFNKDKTEFFPHQDVSLIEETKGNTIFAWIPTTDINEKNGNLLVLSGSHNKFRWQRTHDQANSPLKNIHPEILKLMVPLYISKGDLVLFDNALIHASAPNSTNEVRIAMNTGIAAKSSPLIHYKTIPNNKNNIEKFFIDEDFWYKGYYINPDYIPQKYFPAIKEKIYRTKDFSITEFKKIMDN